MREVRRARYDLAYLFWTGDKEYRSMKLAGLRCRAGATDVDIGDGHIFRLGWGCFLRFLLIRYRHPLPADHDEFVLPPAPVTEQAEQAAPEPPSEEPEPEVHDGDRVLVIQSAEPVYLLRALDHLRDHPLFRNPRYTLFCRNRPEALRSFSAHPLACRLRPHNEARDSLRHLLELRRRRYEGVVVLFTGDPSYWKIKFFAFLLGARHTLIFNENIDCFFFSFGAWLSFLSHRLGERTRYGPVPHWTHHLRMAALMVLKAVLFPARLVWLAGNWLWLMARSR
jgi:hypothetical protein